MKDPLPSRRDLKCRGMIGIAKNGGGPVALELYEGLLMLQHRAADTCAIVTQDGER